MKYILCYKEQIGITNLYYYSNFFKYSWLYFQRTFLHIDNIFFVELQVIQEKNGLTSKIVNVFILNKRNAMHQIGHF